MENRYFADKVRRRADQLGRTHADVCRAMKVPPQRLAEWLEKNQPPTSPRRLLALARELKVPVEYLIDDEIPPGDVPGPDPMVAKIIEVSKDVGLETAYRRIIAAPEPGRSFDRDWGGSPVNDHDGGSNHPK